MTRPERGDDPLFQFDRPSEAHYDSLRQILQSLDPSPFVETGVRRRDNVSVAGTLPQIMERLQSILEADYQDNLVEQNAGVWNFDYVVTRDDRYPDAVQLLTRLHKAGRSGSVLYGRLVKRIENDLYLLWSDD